MKNEPAYWYVNPTKKVIAIFLFIWLVSNLLLILAQTDFFSKPFFSGRVGLITMMMTISTISTAKLVRNYLRKDSKS